MPAFVKSSVGSSCGTSGELRTMRWPFFSKYVRKDERISLEVISFIQSHPGLPNWLPTAAFAEHTHHPIDFEPLPRQLPDQTGKSGVVFGDGVAVQALLDRRLEQRVIVCLV